MRTKVDILVKFVEDLLVGENERVGLGGADDQGRSREAY